MSARLSDDELLIRIEQSGIRASAAPGERWLDGWLVRLSPGKAKRSRCVNALKAGTGRLADKLAEVEALFAAAGLPLFIRITPFSKPAEVDAELSALGWARIDDTRVMVLARLGDLREAACPSGLGFERVGPRDFTQLVGAWRGNPPAQIEAHAERLLRSPLAYEAWLCRQDGVVVTGAQTVAESGLVGLYDVFTAPAHRNRGLAEALCRRLLLRARAGGAQAAYLQVDADNAAARAVYRKLGFADAYGYHYRSPDAAAR